MSGVTRIAMKAAIWLSSEPGIVCLILAARNVCRTLRLCVLVSSLLRTLYGGGDFPCTSYRRWKADLRVSLESWFPTHTHTHIDYGAFRRLWACQTTCWDELHLRLYARIRFYFFFFGTKRPLLLSCDWDANHAQHHIAVSRTSRVITKPHVRHTHWRIYIVAHV